MATDHLILAVDVVQDPGDTEQLVPMFDKVNQALQDLREATGNPDLTIEKALLDAGHASIDNLIAAGPDRLIALGNATRSPARHHPRAHRTSTP